MPEPFDRAAVKVVPGGAVGVAPLPRMSVRERFANTRRCKSCQMVTPLDEMNPETGICKACEGLAAEKSGSAGLPAGMTVQTTVSMPGNASNTQIEAILKSFQVFSAPETLKALELERETLKNKLESIDSLIVRLKSVVGLKRKYTRKGGTKP